MRVESLQQPQAIIHTRRCGVFQYPPCGSSRCNDMVVLPARVYLFFQYPPCGSSRCNTYASGAPSWTWIFQYPPCGSSRCNTCGRATGIDLVLTFSTLHAGRVAATTQ